MLVRRALSRRAACQVNPGGSQRTPMALARGFRSASTRMRHARDAHASLLAQRQSRWARMSGARSPLSSSGGISIGAARPISNHGGGEALVTDRLVTAELLSNLMLFTAADAGLASHE